MQDMQCYTWQRQQNFKIKKKIALAWRPHSQQIKWNIFFYSTIKQEKYNKDLIKRIKSGSTLPFCIWEGILLFNVDLKMYTKWSQCINKDMLNS